MKKAKTLTRKERKAVKKALEAQDAMLPKPARKPVKQKAMFKLSFYLERTAEKKHEKKHHREEKRDAKLGHVHAH